MIKLICPHCMKPVPVPEDFAGREVTCPSCSKVFDAPARYNPAVLPDPPAPAQHAPPPAPPAPQPAATTPPPSSVLPPSTPPLPSQQPQLEGYSHSAGITISPNVVAWLPAILLTVTFFCTFFPWIAAYYGGSPAYWQSPWRALFASVGNNPIYTQHMPTDPVWLTIISLDIGILLPFILLLLVALVVAWLDRFERSIDVRKFPRLAKAWPVRKTTIAVVAGLALLLLLIQLARGFGMERAIRTSVRDNPEIKKAREDASGYPSREAGVENRVEAEMAKYNLERTWWQDIAVLSLLVAVLATILSIGLDKRGNKPPPRIVLHY